MRSRRVALALCAMLAAGTASATAAPPGSAPADRDVAVAPAPGPRIEPGVAVNPRRPNEVLVALMRMRTTRGTGFGQLGRPDVELHLSTDGGRTFAPRGVVPVPEGTSYTGDPSVAFDSSGRAYVAYLGSARTPDGGIFVVRSDDGGRSWPAKATRVASDVMNPDDGCIGHDKPSIAVGPAPRAPRGARRGAAPDSVYVTWHTNAYSDMRCEQAAPSRIRPMFARSTDGGRTFSTPVELTDRMSYAAIPAVGPDGTLHVVHMDTGARACPQSWAEQVTVRTSRDGGRSFTEAAAIEVCFALPGTPTGGVYYSHSLPSIAVNPRTGAVAVSSVHRDVSGDVVVVAARDRRGRWSMREPIPRDPGVVQALPWLAYSPGGRLAAVYLGQAPGGIYDAYVAWSEHDGLEWSAPVKVSSVPSVGNLRSFADTWSLGHYLGLAVGSDEVAHPVWPDIRPGEASMVNIWTRPVRLHR